MSSQTINFITWNVNGLKQKREQKLQKLQNADVVFLQETHIGEGDENIIENLKNEWHVYYTTFTCQKGSAILVKKKIDFEMISNEIDKCGTYVLLKCKLAGQPYTLVSVYNHEKDTITLENLSRYLQSNTIGLLVIGGDFNTVLNPFIDKDNKIISKKVVDSTTHRKLRCCVERFMKSLQLVDVWRRMNPINQDYTFQSQVTSRLDYFFVPEECMWRVRSCEIGTTERRDHKPLHLDITPNIFFQKDPDVQSVPQWLSLKKHILMDETGLLLDAESSNAVSEVDITSAVQSLQVSDTPRPDGIPVSFYKHNINDLVRYIKTLYDRIHRGALNCSQNHFNETVKSPHDNSQHFFNVDYLIIATILAKHLDDFLESHLKGRVLKNAATVMITPKTFSTEMRLSCITDQIEKQKGSNPALYQAFLIVKNLLRDAPQVATDVSIERDKLLDQGCPLTPVLITLALKCFASALVGHLKHDILVFKECVILRIQPEDLEEIIAVGKNRANEVYDITVLSRANVNDEEFNFGGQRSIDEDWNERQTETPLNNLEERTETNWSHIYIGEIGNPLCENHKFISMINDEEDIIMDGDGRPTMYAVVTLQDSDEVMVAASNWLTTDKKQCQWPPFKSPEKCMEAVQGRVKPETGGRPWEKLNIIFHEYQINFDKAKERQRDIREQNERTYLLATGFSGVLKKQRLESCQEMAKNPLLTSSMSTDAQLISTTDRDEIFQMLKNITRTVQENSAMLKKLVKDNTVSEAPSSSSVTAKKKKKASLNLPLRTFEDVTRIEKMLINPTTREKYVKILSRIGGFGPKNVITNIMQKVLTDDLANNFNWQGRGDKTAFSKLTLTDVIGDAASKHSVTKADCENEIKRYLWSAPDRTGQKRPKDCGGVTSGASSSTMLDSPFMSDMGMSLLEF